MKNKLFAIAALSLITTSFANFHDDDGRGRDFNRDRELERERDHDRRDDHERYR